MQMRNWLTKCWRTGALRIFAFAYHWLVYPGIYVLTVTWGRSDRSSKFWVFLLQSAECSDIGSEIMNFLIFRQRACLHMSDFIQPQQKYAGTGENCNIAITANMFKLNNQHKYFHKVFIPGYKMTAIAILPFSPAEMGLLLWERSRPGCTGFKIRISNSRNWDCT